jgi:hypothetical protein
VIGFISRVIFASIFQSHNHDYILVDYSYCHDGYCMLMGYSQKKTIHNITTNGIEILPNW